MRIKIISILMALMLCIGAFPVTAFANADGDVSTGTIIVNDVTAEMDGDGKADEESGTGETEDNSADMQAPIEVSVSEDGTMTYSYGGWTWTVGTGNYETEGTLDAEEIIEAEQTEESEDEEKETKEGAEEDNTTLTGTVIGINSYLNLRSGAGTDYKVIGKLTNGTEVEVIGEENGWYEIVIPEMTGYVYSDYLEVMETVNEEEELDGMDSLGDLDEMLLMTLFSLLFQSDSIEEDTSEAALTPDGNLTLVDDIDTGTDVDAGKQFITVTTRSGNYFYLIIDRDDEGEETVHFLNQVDESDLLSLMDEEDVEKYEASLSEDEVETEETIEQTEAGTVEIETEISEMKENEDSIAVFILVLLLVIVLVAGGGFFAYTKVKSKKEKEEKPDPDADYDEEEDYDDYSGEYEDDPSYSGERKSDFEEDESV